MKKIVTYDYAVIIDDEIIPAFTPIEVEEAAEEGSAAEQPEASKEKAVKRSDNKRSRRVRAGNNPD